MRRAALITILGIVCVLLCPLLPIVWVWNWIMPSQYANAGLENGTVGSTGDY